MRKEIDDLPEERARRKRSIDQSCANVRLRRDDPSWGNRGDQGIKRQYIEGELSCEEHVRLVLRHADIHADNMWASKKDA